MPLVVALVGSYPRRAAMAGAETHDFVVRNCVQRIENMRRKRLQSAFPLWPRVIAGDGNQSSRRRRATSKLLTARLWADS
jgi:hypothetical protein